MLYPGFGVENTLIGQINTAIAQKCTLIPFFGEMDHDN